MVAALPVQDHLDVLGFNAHDDFAQGRTHDPLPCRRRGGRMRPGEFEVDAKPHQLLPTTAVFEPLRGALATLSKRVKSGFDPHGVLNPGRMHEGH